MSPAPTPPWTSWPRRGTGSSCPRPVWSSWTRRSPSPCPGTVCTRSSGGTCPRTAGTAIEEHFGSFESFAAQLTAAAPSVQGSGWGLLAWEPLGRRLIVAQGYDHHATVGIASTPLLVVDAWGQAYYLPYRNVRPDDVQTVWDLVSGDDVARRDAAALRRCGAAASTVPNPLMAP